MRRIAMAGMALVLVSLGCAHAQGGHEENAAEAVIRLGAPITLQQTVPADTLLARPAEYIGDTLLVEGDITGCCDESGCWISFATATGEHIFYAKSADHSLLFPEDCKGYHARVQGVFTARAGAPAGCSVQSASTGCAAAAAPSKSTGCAAAAAPSKSTGCAAAAAPSKSTGCAAAQAAGMGCAATCGAKAAVEPAPQKDGEGHVCPQPAFYLEPLGVEILSS